MYSLKLSISGSFQITDDNTPSGDKVPPARVTDLKVTEIINIIKIEFENSNYFHQCVI